MSNAFIDTTEYSNSAENTEKYGMILAKTMLSDISLPHFIALYGDLGAGKTAFVRGFVSVIAPNAKVKSPTFALVREYLGKNLNVFHFDMYRITDEDDLYSTGFYDYFNRKGIIITEWSENIPYALPDKYIKVTIDKTENENERIITTKLLTREDKDKK